MYIELTPIVATVLVAGLSCVCAFLLLKMIDRLCAFRLERLRYAAHTLTLRPGSADVSRPVRNDDRCETCGDKTLRLYLTNCDATIGKSAMVCRVCDRRQKGD